MVWEEVKSRVWNPKEQEELVGVYLEVEEPEGAHGKMYHFDVKGKGMISVWGCAMLDGKMSQVAKAEVVKLVYNGLTKNSKNQDMHDYTVYIKQTPSVDEILEEEL